MYKDIINLPYPNRETEKDFPNPVNRGAQFAPFAALTGFDAAIEEAARITGREIQLDEGQKEVIDRKIRYIADHLSDNLTVSITYFVADKAKAGGRYVLCRAHPVKVMEFEKELLMDDGSRISVGTILSVEIEDCDI